MQRDPPAPSLPRGTAARPGEVASSWSQGLVLQEAKAHASLGGAGSTFLPQAAHAWAMICSHHITELLKDTPGALQPPANRVSQPFIQAAAHPLRDTSGGYTPGVFGLVFPWEGDGKFKARSPVPGLCAKSTW